MPIKFFRKNLIYCADETAVKHHINWVTYYAPKGQTRMLQRHDGRWKMVTMVTMVSAISNERLLRFKVQDKSMDQFSLIEFLESRIKDESKKIFLSVNNLKAHKSKAVNAWTQDQKDRIEFFYCSVVWSSIRMNMLIRVLKTDIQSRAPRPFMN